MAKQQTVWTWGSFGKPGNSCRVGIVHNKSWGNPFDVIRIQFKGTNGEFDWYMRIDEAIHLAAGVMKVVAKVIWGTGKHHFVLKEYYEKYKSHFEGEANDGQCN